MRAEASRAHVVSHPYARPKDIQGREVFCETCDRLIPTSRWNEHERSKKHQAAKLKANTEATEVKASVSTNPVSDWVAEQSDNGAGLGAWDSYDGAAADATETGDDWVGRDNWGAADNTGDEFTTQLGRRGGDSKDGNCFKCGLSGHFARDWPEAKGSLCFNCNQPGHISRDCPDPPKKKGNGGACHNCGEIGHTRRDCTEPEVNGVGDTSNMECRRCHEIGHMAKECPNGVLCYNCKGFGHVSSECPEPRAGGMTCYNCKESGHIAKNCPQPRTGATFQCFRCGESGHKRGQCPLEQSGSDNGYGAESGGFESHSRIDGGFCDTGELSQALASASWDNDFGGEAADASTNW